MSVNTVEFKALRPVEREWLQERWSDEQLTGHSADRLQEILEQMPISERLIPADVAIAATTTFNMTGLGWREIIGNLALLRYGLPLAVANSGIPKGGVGIIGDDLLRGNGLEPTTIQIVTEILEQAITEVGGRADTYDSPDGKESMPKVIDVFNILYGTELSVEQGWQFMTILKMVRSSQGAFKLDTYVDQAAYSAFAGKAAGDTVRDSDG